MPNNYFSLWLAHTPKTGRNKVEKELKKVFFHGVQFCSISKKAEQKRIFYKARYLSHKQEHHQILVYHRQNHC
jgi:hypothetical protein